MRTLTVTFAGHPHLIHVCETLEDAVEYTDWVHLHTSGGFTVFGVDVETTGLDPWADDFDVTLVQVSDGDMVYIVPPSIPGGIEALTGTLESPKVKVATHTQFDALALCTIGIVLGPKVIDTHILSRLTDPNGNRHGLKPLTQQWLKADELVDADAARHEFFALEAKAHAPSGTMRSKRRIETWGWRHLDPLSPTILAYAGLDALAVRQLAPVLTTALTRENVPVQLIEQELWLGSIVTAMRLQGMRLDVGRVKQLLTDYQEEVRQASETVTTITGLASAQSPKRVEWLGEHGVVFDPERVTEKGRPQLSKDVLPDLCERYPSGDVGVVLECSRLISDRKNAVGNLNNFLKHADQYGYVHPEIKTLGAKTGRMSVVNPALQTLKKSDPVLRGCFIAEDGMCFISADFSQIEVRVAAALSGDQALAAPILNGEDTHDSTARHLFGENFTKQQRQIAKTVNFGSLYGGGAGTLSRQSGIELDEARSVVNKWKATYKQVARMSQVLSDMPVIVNPAGRRIPSDPERRYANLNYLIQSTARDLFVVAVERIVAEFGPDALWMFVHDEVILHVPVNEADDVAKRVQDLMHTVFYGIPLDAEAEVLGGRWGAGENA